MLHVPVLATSRSVWRRQSVGCVATACVMDGVAGHGASVDSDSAVRCGAVRCCTAPEFWLGFKSLCATASVVVRGTRNVAVFLAAVD